GLFAISEIIFQLTRPAAASRVNAATERAVFGEVARGVLRRFKGVLSKGSLIGVLIGVMPGAGAAIATFIAYGEAKRGSKHPEKFGHGAPEGIVAAEAANNSAVCGSLVPLLALGIPGSVTCAIMYGALTLHGIIPGPRLLQTSGDFVYTFMAGMVLTTFFMLLIGRCGLRLFSLALKAPIRMLMPCILILCMVGAFSINNSMFDVLLASIFGLMGYFFKLARIPVAPVVLGLILGPIMEEGVRQSLMMAKAHHMNILLMLLERPASLALMVILGALCWASVVSAIRTRKLGGKLEE
ncbi:tripartite tricarboxylate transporter permease, partial [Desulfovibrio sp. SGI.169]|uniref:tripartite tricarboxylate transporter permease n=1 Tax=Desulfovibrio sp. SGI.169 TaxID=3420561 RepID=UPI003CFFBC18